MNCYLRPFQSWLNSVLRYKQSLPCSQQFLLSGLITCNVQVRVSKDDLERERGAVMEEYRGNRNATGRMQDAHWILMMEGSQVPLL